MRFRSIPFLAEGILLSYFRTHSALGMQRYSLVVSEGQHGARSCTPCGCVSIICCRGKHGQTPCALYHLLRAAWKSKEKLSFAKLAFMSFLFPESHCLASGLDLRWMLLILSGLSPQLTEFQIPAFHCQTTCPCPLLFIAPCGSLSGSFSDVHVMLSLIHYRHLSALFPTPCATTEPLRSWTTEYCYISLSSP